MAFIEISPDVKLDEPQKRFVELGKNEPLDVVSDPFQELAQEPGFFQAGAISTGRGIFKILRALGLAEPETETEKKAFEALGKERPIATTVGEAVGESLPFLPLGVGVGQIAALPVRIAATTGIGALEGGLIARGTGGKEREQIISAGIGGTVAGGLEASLPIIGRIGGALIRKALKRAPKSNILTPDGLPTEELTQALEKQGLKFDDIKDAAAELLAETPPGADPEQGIRSAMLKFQGLADEAAPTKAQITRDPTLFQQQQELAKTSGKVRTRLESQQGILTNNFDEAISGTTGKPVTSGSPVFDHITNKATALDNEISGLYKTASERAKGAKAVDLSKTFARLESLRPSDRLMKGAISSLEGEAARLGLLDPKTGVSAMATVEEAELLRKFSNQIFQSTSDFGKTGLRQFRNAIDDDVTKSAGEDIFKSGRTAKAKFEADLSRSKIGKFDKRNVSLVRDVLENKIDPDAFLNKVVLGKKYRREDLKSLKKYLTTGTDEQIEQGTKAFNDLRAETLDFIKNKSFVGPEDAAGNKNLSRAALESSINRIGMDKLSVLLEPQEIKFLKDMINVSKILEPPRGTVLGKGPTAQAVESLKRRLDKIPILNIFVDLQLDGSGRFLKAKPIVRTQNLPRIDRLQKELAPIIPLTGVAATEQLRQGENQR